MKDIKKIIKKLGEVRDLLDQNLEASNMDVEHMSQRVEDMIEEIEEAGEFEFEEEEGD
jgi:CHAD domain-containing protein